MSSATHVSVASPDKRNSLLNDEPEYEEALHLPRHESVCSVQYYLQQPQQSPYSQDIRQDDPECEYFDLTQLSSDDLTNTTATITLESVGKAGHYTVNKSPCRTPLLGRPGEELDEEGRHPADYHDLTILSEEEEDAFKRVFQVVSKVKDVHSRQPSPSNIVDLTAVTAARNSPIVDLTRLTAASDEEDQFTENGSVLLDLTHVTEEDITDYEDFEIFGGQNRPDPFPSLMTAHVRSCDSLGSGGSTASRYQAGSFDWMTKPGPTSVDEKNTVPAVTETAVKPPVIRKVQWLSPVEQEAKVVAGQCNNSSLLDVYDDSEGVDESSDCSSSTPPPADPSDQHAENSSAGVTAATKAASLLSIFWDPAAALARHQATKVGGSHQHHKTEESKLADSSKYVPNADHDNKKETSTKDDQDFVTGTHSQQCDSEDKSPEESLDDGKESSEENFELQRKMRKESLSHDVPFNTDTKAVNEGVEIERERSTSPTTKKSKMNKSSVKTGKTKRSKGSKGSKSKKKKKRRSKSNSAKKESSLVITWKRIKESLKPRRIQDQKFNLLPPSASDGEDTIVDQRKRCEEIRKSIELEAAESVSRKKKRPKSARRRSKGSHQGSGASSCDANADAASEIEHEGGTRNNDDVLERPGLEETDSLLSTDFKVNQRMSEVARAAIAFAAASRDPSRLSGEEELYDKLFSSTRENVLPELEQMDEDEKSHNANVFEKHSHNTCSIEKESNPSHPHINDDHSMYSVAHSSSSGEEADNGVHLAEESTSVVPETSNLIVDPYETHKRDYNWLYGNSVKLPSFAQSAMDCCGAWHQDTPTAKAGRSDKQQKGTGASTTTTNTSPFSCLVWTENGDPFCNVPIDLYNDNVFSVSKGDDEASHPSKPNFYSTFKSYGISMQVEKPSVFFADGGFGDKFCGSSSLGETSQMSSHFSLSEQCGALESSMADLNGPIINPCSTIKPKRKKTSTKKSENDTLFSKLSKKKLKKKKNCSKPSPDAVDVTKTCTADSVDDKGRSKYTSKFDTILQAQEEAFAKLRQNLSVEEDVAEEDKSLEKEDPEDCQSIASTAEHENGTHVQPMVYQNVPMVYSDNYREEPPQEHILSPKSVPSERCGITTANQAESIHDIDFGYSESNIDARSVDAEQQVEQRDKTRHEDRSGQTSSPQVSAQPFSDFLLGIFGGVTEKDPCVPGAVPTIGSNSSAGTMHKPNSLQSLVSNDSNSDLNSDGSLSSLSLSLQGAKNKVPGQPASSSSLDRQRLENLISDLMSHKHGMIFVSVPMIQPPLALRSLLFTVSHFS